MGNYNKELAAKIVKALVDAGWSTHGSQKYGVVDNDKLYQIILAQTAPYRITIPLPPFAERKREGKTDDQFTK